MGFKNSLQKNILRYTGWLSSLASLWIFYMLPSFSVLSSILIIISVFLFFYFFRIPIKILSFCLFVSTLVYFYTTSAGFAFLFFTSTLQLYVIYSIGVKSEDLIAIPFNINTMENNGLFLFMRGAVSICLFIICILWIPSLIESRYSTPFLQVYDPIRISVLMLIAIAPVCCFFSRISVAFFAIISLFMARTTLFSLVSSGFIVIIADKLKNYAISFRNYTINSYNLIAIVPLFVFGLYFVILSLLNIFGFSFDPSSAVTTFGGWKRFLHLTDINIIARLLADSHAIRDIYDYFWVGGLSQVSEFPLDKISDVFIFKHNIQWYVHNTYLEMLLVYGFLGLIPVLSMLCTPIVYFKQIMPTDGSNFTKYSSSAASVILITSMPLAFNGIQGFGSVYIVMSLFWSAYVLGCKDLTQSSLIKTDQ